MTKGRRRAQALRGGGIPGCRPIPGGRASAASAWDRSRRSRRRLPGTFVTLFLALLLAACRSPSPPGNTFHKGLALSEIHPGHGEEVYASALDRIGDIGADWVLLPVYGYMDSAGSATMDTLWEPPVTMDEYRDFVRGLIRDAHRRHLSVLLIPYLNLRTGPPADWRGNIHPPDWPGWFSSYETFLGGWIDLVQAENVEMVAVGAELVSSEAHTDAWRRLIARVRERYDGIVIYSFNWDHYAEAAFHRDLDLVGISGYFSLPAGAPLTGESIEANWREVRGRLEAFGRETGREILFTEVGYASVEGSARDPWNYLLEAPLDTAGQARAIAAFIRAWDGAPGLRGVFFWNFSPVRGGPDDPSYSIGSKPAETIVRNWFAKKSN